MAVCTCKCDGLNKCETSTKACSANKVSACGSTDKIFLPLTSSVDTKSPADIQNNASNAANLQQVARVDTSN